MEVHGLSVILFECVSLLMKSFVSEVFASMYMEESSIYTQMVFLVCIMEEKKRSGYNANKV